MISNEQKTVVDWITENDGMALVSAVAGSGKSYTLVQAASTIPGNCLYLAYNKSAKLDAEKRFGPNTTCKTIDALAYQYIIGQGLSMNGIRAGKRTLDFFNWRNIDLELRYEEKVKVVDTMNEYFASKYVSLKDFLITYEVQPNVKAAIVHYVKQMAQKEIPCTFAFSKKYFHILLSRGVINFPQYKAVFLDELQDSSEVVLEIFKTIDCKKKIGVGDEHQSIYGFNYCVNGFNYLHENADLTLRLTQSYRCSKEISEKIEIFSRKYLDKDLEFRGIDYDDLTITSKAHIARTNSSLVSKMMKLNDRNIAYNLTRPAKEIFGLALTILSLKPGCTIYKPEFKFLLQDMEYYYRTPSARTQYDTLTKYIASEHSRDRTIKSAISAIVKYGGQKIFQAFNIAKAHEEAKVTHELTLTTSHASKGLEWDEVFIDGDMNPDFLDGTSKMTHEEIEEELRLIYVAVSRAKIKLENVNWLTTI